MFKQNDVNSYYPGRGSLTIWELFLIDDLQLLGEDSVQRQREQGRHDPEMPTT